MQIPGEIAWGAGWLLAAFLIFVIFTVVGMMIDNGRRARYEKQALADWQAPKRLLSSDKGEEQRMTREADGDVRIPCPICGKRLTDANGHKCDGDFFLEMKCPNTKSCGLVKIDAQYIAKFLDKRNRAL